MPKYCCAANCSNVFTKGSEVKFYRFPSDPERKAKWIAAINRKDWYPTEYSWICSEHFVSGEKSNNQFAPNYVPTIFKHVKVRLNEGWKQRWPIFKEGRPRGRDE